MRKPTKREYQRIEEGLYNPKFDDYTAVFFAREEIENNDFPAAINRLKVDLDKIRPIDNELYHLVRSIIWPEDY